MNSLASKVVIPSKVESIGDCAFGFMPNLTEFHSQAPNPPFCSVFGPFSDDEYSTCTLYVPNGSLRAYQNADGWKNFFNFGVSSGINGMVADTPSDSEWFTLGGQRTTTPQKGLYVVGGKKVLKK